MKYIIHLLAIILAFVLLLSAYGGRVDPVVWTLPSMLTLALPVVLLFVIVAMVLLAIFKQWRAVVVLLGALLLSWPTIRLISPFNISHPKADTEKTQLKVLTMNVTEFNWQKGNEPSENMRYILDQDADIVVIQEGLVYFSFENLSTVKPMLKELYKKYPYRKKVNYFIKAWDVEAPGGELRVVNMHLSSLRFTANDSQVIESMNVPSDRKRRIKSVAQKLGNGFISHSRQAKAVRQLLDETSGDVLVMGDMNDTPGSFTYRTVCGEDLRDAWVDTGFGPIYTFHAHHLYVKIDHIFYRGDMKVLSCRRDKEGESDHYPLVAVFER